MLAYFDCFSGIAGDMIIAAMLDAGLDRGLFTDSISGLKLTGYNLSVSKETRRGISGHYFRVDIDKDQPHRSFNDIRDIIESSDLKESIKVKSLDIFTNIGLAEAKVHGTVLDDVHFHEIGAVDSIIDIVGACIGIDALDIDEVESSPMPVNLGATKSCHGVIPLPAPATLELLKGIPVKGASSDFELVTPTGAGIIKTICHRFGGYPDFSPLAIGYGLGKSDTPHFPNALRIALGKRSVSTVYSDEVVKLESNIDDLDPRVLGRLMDELFDLPVLDATFCGIQMKKNRPGVLLTVLVTPERSSQAAQLIMSSTTSLGVRAQTLNRFTLERKTSIERTTCGNVGVKSVKLPDGRWEKRVEFDDAVKISKSSGTSVREILNRLHKELNDREI